MISPLDVYFKMIRTNTEASSIHEATSRAKVFLFCETHNSSKYQIANSIAYDFLSIPGAKFFVEGPVKSHIPESTPDIKSRAVSWEDVSLTEGVFKELDKDREKLFSASSKFFLLLLSASLIIRSFERTGGEQTEEFDGTLFDGFFEHVEELKKFDFFNSISFPEKDNFHSHQIDGLVRSLAQAWAAGWGKNIDDFSNEIDRQALVRNTQLSNTLLKAHAEGATRILAVAGSDHLKIHKAYQTEEGVAAIAALYKSLEEAGVPYVTLKATNKNLPIPQLSPQPPSASEKGKEPEKVDENQSEGSLNVQSPSYFSLTVNGLREHSSRGNTPAYVVSPRLNQFEQYLGIAGPSSMSTTLHIPQSDASLKRTISEVSVSSAKRSRVEDYVKDIRERSQSAGAGSDRSLYLDDVEEESGELSSGSGDDDSSYDIGDPIEIPVAPSDMSDFNSDDDSDVSSEGIPRVEREAENLDNMYFMGAVMALQNESHPLRSSSTTSSQLNRQLSRTLKYVMNPILEKGAQVFKED